ncbi:TLC ATP/ADP transporter [Actinidia rufa]|uniref:ADP,ATP carrier protein n=1 Tax=Actinidia rufa TaxID=165716 RepID=A0A7J0FZK1_9ERIC|nr:TLC ATP/ADP transporter [Actinidia rufa]
MEAVLQTKGLLSLPSNPNPKGFNSSSQGLRHRFKTLKPKSLGGFSLSLNGLSKSQGFATKPPGFGKNGRDFHAGRAEAASAADGQPLFEESESPKFMGFEILTLKKIIPLGLMFFCILFNYTILRDTKDVLVVTAKGSSAEIIPFLKTWVNLPMAVGFMLLYTKLANVLSKQALFYTVIVPFIAFFGAFGFVLYPLSHYFHPTALADKLLAMLGPRFLGPLAIIRIWSFCLFYVMAELWGSVVISVLFWGFANQITTVEEAKRFYPLFGLGANVALIFSGRTVKYFSNLRKNLGPGVGWLGHLVESNDEHCGADGPCNLLHLLEKPSMGTMESLKFLVSSRYIRDLATLVVAYGISINLVEVTLRENRSSKLSFQAQMSTLPSWVTSQLQLPYTLVQCRIFFSKSAKYSLFDPCKEMAYIPLDEETKVKGKAAIDVVCNPLGKSGGALIQQFMILTFGSLANSTPYLGGILLVIVLAWLAAAKSLDTQFTALRREEELEKEMERAAVKVPVVAETEKGNGSPVSGPALDPTRRQRLA